MENNVEYIHITIPSSYLEVYNSIITMLADYGEEMLKDCKAGCTAKNEGVIECYNMFNAAVAARRVGKEKLAETILKYVKGKINQIYRGRSTAIEIDVVPGIISIVRNNNNNDYSTQAMITLSPSTTINTVNSYSQDYGETWEVFIEDINIVTETSQDVGKYQIQTSKETYTKTITVKSDAFILNKKKMYYGMGDSILENEVDIKVLTGGGSLEKDIMQGEYVISTETIGQYIWFCGTGVINTVLSNGFEVPMMPVSIVNGYNCYRSVSAIQEPGVNIFKII